MKNSLLVAASAPVVLAAVLLVSGCAEPSSGGPAPSSDAKADSATTPADTLELDAAWLDEGRMVAVVTVGSSTCIPVAEEVTADGQTVSITLSEGDPSQPCTMDLTERASLVALPDGVDPTQDVELTATLGSATGDVDLVGNPALTGLPGEPTTFEASAGWFDDGKLVLATWGSSTCLPVVESVEASGNAGTVSFAAQDGVCTMDMVPRATVIDFAGIGEVTQDAFVLTLVGDNLDGTVNVLAG